MVHDAGRAPKSVRGGLTFRCTEDTRTELRLRRNGTDFGNGNFCRCLVVQNIFASSSLVQHSTARDELHVEPYSDVTYQQYGVCSLCDLHPIAQQRAAVSVVVALQCHYNNECCDADGPRDDGGSCGDGGACDDHWWNCDDELQCGALLGASE